MKKLWFKRKQYGWGWQPSTWQGWLVLFIYLVAVLTSVTLIHLTMEATGEDGNLVVGVVFPVLILTVILISICYAKGEKPKWQWGKDTNTDS